jgi:hypothetical protein
MDAFITPQGQKTFRADLTKGTGFPGRDLEFLRFVAKFEPEGND